MKIVCESCGAKYSIADEKVAGKVFKIRCKKCSAVIVVKGDQPQEGAESTRVFDYGGEAVWHVVVGGEQQGPFAPRQIGELLAEGKIDWEAYVWRENMEGWQPAKDVEDLVKAVMAEAEGGESQKRASAAPPPAGEVFGGSSDMGADPFASGDDGGLSGVMGQSAAAAAAAASATAAGGGADLFADSSRSAFARAADDDDVGHLGAGLGPKVSEGQAMTGQRNENSVLFSLSNLQALATGSGAAPTSGRPKPGMAQGEGSGLIDIRALASATQAVGEKPNGSSRDKVEDLLAVGATNTTFSATSFAAPVAAEKPSQNWPLLAGMGLAILGLGGALTYLVVREQPEAQLTPSQDPPAEQAAGAAAVGTTATAEAPQAAEPSPAPSPSSDEPDEPAAAAGSDEERDERRDRDERGDRRSSRRRSGESSAKDDKTEATAAAEAEPAPTPKKSSGDKSLDDLLDTALSGKPKPSAAKPEASEDLPATPSREDVLAAMKSITPRVQACGTGQSGVAMAKVGVAGPTGKVSSVDVSGQFAGTPVAACISKEVAKAKFPRFSQSTFSYSYPFKL